MCWSDVDVYVWPVSTGNILLLGPGPGVTWWCLANSSNCFLGLASQCKLLRPMSWSSASKYKRHHYAPAFIFRSWSSLNHPMENPTSIPCHIPLTSHHSSVRELPTRAWAPRSTGSCPTWTAQSWGSWRWSQSRGFPNSSISVFCFQFLHINVEIYIFIFYLFIVWLFLFTPFNVWD